MLISRFYLLCVHIYNPTVYDIPYYGLVQGNNAYNDHSLNVILPNGKLCKYPDNGIPDYNLSTKAMYSHGLVEHRGVVYKVGGKGRPSDEKRGRFS